MLFQILLHLTLLHHASSATVSLTDVPAYSSQRPCALGCFNGNLWPGPDSLASAIDCPSGYGNDCFCRADLQTSADSYLLSCAVKTCSGNTIDVDSATSIYDTYCTSAGYNRVDAAATTTGEAYPVATVTVTAIQTVFVSSGERVLRRPFEGLGAWIGMQ